MMEHVASPDRYSQMSYRRCGRSGLELPILSFGLWHNFGQDKPRVEQRAMLCRALDLGMTHFDLANNYGPPAGAAEETLGDVLATDLRPYRDELAISTKAGYPMWQGPYGGSGSAKHLTASLDQSLRRLRLDYVDIFYSHRADARTPVEETVMALDRAVRQGKALYVGVSSYSPERTRQAASLLRELGTPLTIHQPSYSMLNRWIEKELLDVLSDEGVGCIGFSPLGQGTLTDRYLEGIPDGSRATAQKSLGASLLSDTVIGHVRALNQIALQRGQTMAQMALAWALRDPRMTSVVLGASSTEHLEQNVKALANLQFDDEELRRIDEHAVDSGIDLWEASRGI